MRSVRLISGIAKENNVRLNRRLGPLTARGAAVTLAVAVIAAPLSLAAAAPAAAASTTAVNIVGTSDVSDSNLIQSVIAPGFAAAYPQYTLNYIAKGTGAAITYAESGAADGLIVHAESLENQFVDPGAGLPSYSEEPAGRAIFYGDFVLLGPPTDPAGVMASDPHDIVDAFKAIANAGAAGKADFVSRGGTPGTTVEEHQIWQYLTDSSGASTVSGLTQCQVSAANGGGYSPSTTSGACPASISYPSWYHATGLTQGPNVEAGDTCNFANALSSKNNDCYVLTDRGTFDYLESTHAISSLKVVTRDDSATAPGGSTLLTNYFHAYAINPAAVPAASNIDVTGAADFLNYLTSPAAQLAVSGYLVGVNGDTAPFTGDAAPVVTASEPKKPLLQGGTTQTIHGQLINVAPATPPLASQPVTLVVTNHGVTSTAGTATTDATGHYALSFKPTTSGVYQVQSGELTQVENTSITPTFSDKLAPSSVPVGTLTVQAHPMIKKATVKSSTLTVKGSLHPLAVLSTGTVSLRLKKPGATTYQTVRTKTITKGTKTFALKAHLAKPGKYAFEIRWAIPGQVSSGKTAPRHVTRS
jgi:tungstate transport system substrate-binding protein